VRPAWRGLPKTRNKTPYSAQHLEPRLVRGSFFSKTCFIEFTAARIQRVFSVMSATQRRLGLAMQRVCLHLPKGPRRWGTTVCGNAS